MLSDSPPALRGTEAVDVVRTKVARHDAIRAILEEQQVTSQQDLRRALVQMGFDTVQATLSRDLAELGAAKVRGENGALVYRINDGGRAPSAVELGPARLTRWCQELLVGAEYAQNILVLRTAAGAANMLGAAVDAARLEQVVGTVAGDDTILTVCKSEADAASLREQLLGLAHATR